MQHPKNEDAELRQRLAQVEQEKAVLQRQLAVQKYVSQYAVSLAWPAVPSGNKRTNYDLIQHRLLEAGIVYETPIPTGEIYQAANAFIENLEASDCFHSVGVEIGGPANAPQQQHRLLHVHLQEKNWYRLHAGAGLKADMFSGSQRGGVGVAHDAIVPPAELEISAGLRNLAGCLDTTELQYTLDTLQMGALKLSHHRPLYTILPYGLGDMLLESNVGSQYTLQAQAALDTIDADWISSYKLFQRYLSVQVATPRTDAPWWASLEWRFAYRDLIPRRYPRTTHQYHAWASPAIARLAGPSLLHSVTAQWEYDDVRIRDPYSQLPLLGREGRVETTVAMPPGPWWAKAYAAGAIHRLLDPRGRLAGHLTGSVGYIRAMEGKGHPYHPNPSSLLPIDRWMVGGIGSLRGFSTGGVGPRSRFGSSSRMGDALGGTFMYSASALVSATPPFSFNAATTAPAERNKSAPRDPLRLFGFCTAGTCLGDDETSAVNILQSTRVAVGVGISTQILGQPRLEATYAWPLRYHPQDGRRRFQLGVTLSVT